MSTMPNECTSNTGMFAVVAAGVQHNLVMPDDVNLSTYRPVAFFNNKYACFVWACRNSGMYSPAYHVIPATPEMLRDAIRRY